MSTTSDAICETHPVPNLISSPSKINHPKLSNTPIKEQIGVTEANLSNNDKSYKQSHHSTFNKGFPSILTRATFDGIMDTIADSARFCKYDTLLDLKYS